MSEMHEMNHNSKENATLFQEMAVLWLETISCQIKESSYCKYRNLTRLYVLPLFGTVPLNAISHSFIQQQCNHLLQSGGANGTGLSPKTVQDTLSLVRRILEYALQQEKDVRCDGKAVRIKQRQKDISVLTSREQEQLYRYILSHPTPDHLGILLSLFAGLRLGEVCALQWEDISYTEEVLHVRKTLQRIQTQDTHTQRTKIMMTAPKSQKSARTIPLPPEIVQLLFLQSTEKTGFFLTGSPEKYMEPRTLQNHFKRVLQACGISPVNYHCLRHTFATRCVELGFDVKTLSEILGHSNVNITMNRYVHPSMELKKENMCRLSALLTAAGS